MSTTVTQPAPSAPEETEPATLPLPRRQPGRTYPGRPPIERPVTGPLPDALLLKVLLHATGVC